MRRMQHSYAEAFLVLLVFAETTREEIACNIIIRQDLHLLPKVFLVYLERTSDETTSNIAIQLDFNFLLKMYVTAEGIPSGTVVEYDACFGDHSGITPYVNRWKQDQDVASPMMNRLGLMSLGFHSLARIPVFRTQICASSAAGSGMEVRPIQSVC